LLKIDINGMAKKKVACCQRKNYNQNFCKKYESMIIIIFEFLQYS
jgi:hypothetical protein